MRGADGGPWRRLCALPAFWVVIIAMSIKEQLIKPLLMINFRPCLGNFFSEASAHLVFF